MSDSPQPSVVSSTSPPPAPAPQFDAFISYKQLTESRLAAALRHGLHTFAKPWHKLRAMRVFLDSATMTAGLRLSQNLRDAVRGSRHFIYLASPEAAESPWVEEELTEFLTTHQPERLIIVLAAGEIEWDRAAKDFDWQKTTAMPRLRQGLITPDASPLSDVLYHDARWARGSQDLESDPRLRDLVATLSATLRGVPKDKLIGRDVALRLRALRLAWGAAILLGALAIAAGVAARIAQSQQRLAVQRLTRAYVANAMQLVDAGDPLSALPWLGAALDAEPRGAAGHTHRQRLAAVLRHTPRLEHRWIFPGPVRNVVLSRDGRRMAVVTGTEFNDPMVSSQLGELERVGNAQVFDVETRRAVTPVLRHRAGISTVAFSPDGTLLLTAGADSTAVLWDLRHPRAAPRHVLRHAAHVEHAEFSRDGRRVMTLDAGIHVWSVADGTHLGSPPVQPDGFYSADMDSTGSSVVFGTPVQSWNVGAAAARAVPAFAGRRAEGVRFTPDGRRIVATEAIGTIEIGRAQRHVVLQAARATGARVGPEIAMESDISMLDFSADGRKLVTVGGSTVGGEIPRGLRVWDAVTGTPLTRWLTAPHEVEFAAFSRDGRWVLAYASGGAARLWRAEPDFTPQMQMAGARDTAAPRFTFPISHDGGVTAARLLPDGHRLLTAGGREVRLWELVLREPRLAPEVRPPEEWPSPSGEARSPDGRWTAQLGDAVRAGPGSRHVIVHDARRPDAAHALRFPEIILWLRISPDGRLLAALGEMGGVWLWELERKEFRPALRMEHGALYPEAEFSSDGRRMLTIATHARVWDTRTGQPLTPPLRHPRSGAELPAVRHAAFDATATRVVTTSSDSTVRVWDASTGEPLTPPLRAVARPVEFSWFSADGRTVLGFGDGDPPPLAWSLAPETRPAEDARRAVEILSSLRIDETGALVPVADGSP